jgi:hypothetical protein
MRFPKHGALPPARNRGPRLRIFFSRKSGRPDLRWERVGEGGGSKRRVLWLTPHPTQCSLRSHCATLSHKGRGEGQNHDR